MARAQKRAPVVVLLAIAISIVGSLVAAQPSQPATVVVRGTIQSYDAASRLLVLATSNGVAKFTITSAVHIREHWHAIEASALKALSGHRVALRYVESGDEHIVKSVRVFGKNEERP